MNRVERVLLAGLVHANALPKILRYRQLVLESQLSQLEDGDLGRVTCSRHGNLEVLDDNVQEGKLHGKLRLLLLHVQEGLAQHHSRLLQ